MSVHCFAGIVLRRHLCVLLEKRAFHASPPGDFLRGEYFTWFTRRSARNPRSTRDSRLVPWADLEDHFPYFPDPRTVPLSPEDRCGAARVCACVCVCGI